MYARITTNLLNRNLLGALGETQQGQNTALTQLETQRRVNVPSDDPAAAALYSSSQSASAATTQYLQNISSLTGQLQVGDSALSTAVTLLNRAVAVGTEGGTGTLSASDEQALGQEITQIQQQMVSVANTTFQGNPVFAGTAAGPAYKIDAASPDGVAYQGNTQINQAEVAPGSKITINVPGSDIFQNGSGSVFQSLQDLKNALNSNNPAAAQSALSEVNQSLDQLSQQRVFYGSTVNQLTQTQQFLQNENLNLTQQQSTLVGVDMAAAITNLSSAEMARTAILNAGAQINKTSLLNFLSN